MHVALFCAVHKNVQCLFSTQHIKESNCNNRNSSLSQGKKAVFLRFSKVAGTKCITTVLTEKRSKKSGNDHSEFQAQIPQQLVHRYKHMDSRNERWMMMLKVVPLT